MFIHKSKLSRKVVDSSPKLANKDWIRENLRTQVLAPLFSC